jgi:predicted nucleic acid-binding protein
MGQYLIDNNVISNYFTVSFPPNAMRFISDVIDEIPNISVITEIEALSWIAPDKAYETAIEEFINDANILPLTQQVVAECVQIRRSRKIKTPDAIIAATAIVNDFTLITSDADFNRIPNLRILNPFVMRCSAPTN